MELIVIILLLSLFLFPIGMVIWFVNKVIDYRECPAEKEREKQEKRNWVILSGIAAVITVGGVIFLIASFTLGIMYM